MKLSDFRQQPVNWRQTLRLNNRRTIYVISTFILIYALVGFVIDIYLVSSTRPHVPLSDIIKSLLTLNPFPIATFVVACIAVIAVFIAFQLHNTLMLFGTEYREITPETARSLQEKQLYNVVEEMKVAAGLHYMPKVFIVEADYMNAFASGYSEKSAMIAITKGLLEKLNRTELQAVMAHELSHIRHMDIKLTLMASVLANIMLIIIDMLFYNMMFSRREGNGNGRKGGLFFIIMLLRILLPLITVILILYLSRTREYMADAGCVELMRDNQPLASALIKIYNDHSANQDNYTAAYQQTPHESLRREAYIFDPSEAGIKFIDSLTDLFSTHPKLEQRLAAIGFNFKNK